MNDSLLHGVISGTDGVVPLFEPNAPWKMWALPEVYLGEDGLRKYVPKPLDYVVDPPTFTVYIVRSLDPVSFIPVLERIRPADLSFTLGQDDILFGAGVGEQSQQMRVYLNKSTTPYSLQVDQFLRIGGTQTAYAKIFRGSTLTNQGEVVSRIHDASGALISENVPLELVTLDSHTNYALKSVAECKCITDMIDNELLTIVFYSSSGIPVSKNQLLVEVTDYIKPLNEGNKYITHIDLESPFMSEGNNNQIDFPLNVTKNSANFEGVVYYSDGSTKRYPVNGTRFTLLGFDQLLSTVEGQTIDLGLRYMLQPGEGSYAPNTVQGKYIMKAYSLSVLNPNNSYSVKLLHYPRWNEITQGYDLQWWLVSLDRTYVLDVTGLVHIDPTKGAWDPFLFGTRQRKQVSLNLKTVSAAFTPFVHTQLIDVCLFGKPEAQGTAWTVCNEAGINHVDYGTDLCALKTGASTVSLQNGKQTPAEWLDSVYKSTYPLRNPTTEVAAPLPSHFAIRYGSVRKVFELLEWNDELDLGVPVEVYKNITIEFIKRTGTNDIFLSVAELIIYS